MKSHTSQKSIQHNFCSFRHLIISGDKNPSVFVWYKLHSEAYQNVLMLKDFAITLLPMLQQIYVELSSLIVSGTKITSRATWLWKIRIFFVFLFLLWKELFCLSLRRCFIRFSTNNDFVSCYLLIFFKLFFSSFPLFFMFFFPLFLGMFLLKVVLFRLFSSRVSFFCKLLAISKEREREVPRMIERER